MFFQIESICFDRFIGLSIDCCGMALGSVWVVFARKTMGFDGKPWVLMRLMFHSIGLISKSATSVSVSAYQTAP